MDEKRFEKPDDWDDAARQSMSDQSEFAYGADYVWDEYVEPLKVELRSESIANKIYFCGLMINILIDLFRWFV